MGAVPLGQTPLPRIRRGRRAVRRWGRRQVVLVGICQCSAVLTPSRRQRHGRADAAGAAQCWGPHPRYCDLAARARAQTWAGGDWNNRPARRPSRTNPLHVDPTPVHFLTHFPFPWLERAGPQVSLAARFTSRPIEVIWRRSPLLTGTRQPYTPRASPGHAARFPRYPITTAAWAASSGRRSFDATQTQPATRRFQIQRTGRPRCCFRVVGSATGSLRLDRTRCAARTKGSACQGSGEVGAKPREHRRCFRGLRAAGRKVGARPSFCGSWRLCCDLHRPAFTAIHPLDFSSYHASPTAQPPGGGLPQD
jgi:hypothetical protein